MCVVWKDSLHLLAKASMECRSFALRRRKYLWLGQNWYRQLLLLYQSYFHFSAPLYLWHYDYVLLEFEGACRLKILDGCVTHLELLLG